ncbi:MAG: hypothetical protein K1X29_04340 [Bdellovibrionales bacterium]|nr:hypothetical protein [Bdellovibrionales bacterium]
MESKIDENEKEFLHQLSSPIMVGQGWLERLKLRHPEIINCQEFLHLEKQLEKIKQLVINRRQILHENKGGN